MSLETMADEEFDNAIQGLDIDGIPPSNKLPEDFFYNYAYPRLTGLVEDPVFIAKYTHQFGFYNKVELYNLEHETVSTVPGLVSTGEVNSEVDINKLMDEINDADRRHKGLGVQIAEQELSKIMPTKTVGSPWLPVHEEYRKRNNIVAPYNTETTSELDDVMDWD